MSTLTPTLSPQAPRLNQITQAIRDLAQQVMQPAQDVSDAAAALNDQRAGVTSLRETLMLQVATLSADNAWTKGEIDAAAKEAGKLNTNRPDGDKPTAGEKTMGVFISDLRQVANPKVCDHFKSLLSMRDDAWAIEDEAYDAAATKELKALVARPCRKLWGRKYHMLMSMVRDTIDEKADFTSTGSVIEHAIRNDPDLNAEKVKARLEAIVAKLTEIHHDFQHDDIKTCIDFLNVIDVEQLITTKVSKNLTTVEKAPTPVRALSAQVQKPALVPAIGSDDDMDSMLSTIDEATNNMRAA